MFRFRWVIRVRTITTLLLSAIIFYALFQSRRSHRLGLEYGPTPVQKELQSNPVYEYTSLYRLKADSEFEELLSQKLKSVEEIARDSGLETLLAKQIIWQIASPKEKKIWSSRAAQWSNMNPDWIYSIQLSTPEDLLEIFQSVPEIEDTMEKFSSIRKDLVRYLLLWYYGGLYASIDTWSRVALNDCPPIATVMRNNDMNIGLMIGVAIDEPFLSPKTMEQWGWLRSFGFGLDVLWAPRRFDPLLKTAIVRSISHARIHEEITKISGIGLETLTQILEEVSGAAMFTDIVLESLTSRLSQDDNLRDPDAGIARRVTWKKFKGLKKTIWIEEYKTASQSVIPGLAILPVNIWSNGQNHSYSEPHSAIDACVNQPHDINLNRKWRVKEFGLRNA